MWLECRQVPQMLDRCKDLVKTLSYRWLSIEIGFVLPALCLADVIFTVTIRLNADIWAKRNTAITENAN